MKTGSTMRRFSAALIVAGMLCLVISPAAAFDFPEFPIPYFEFWSDHDSCSIGHLTDCQITFGVRYGYLGMRGPDWDILMTWNPLQMKLIEPMRMCLYQDIKDGFNGCYGGDYDGGQSMKLQVIDPTLQEGTVLSTHITARGSELYEKDVGVVVPEFPTAVLPGAIISGFLGVVLFFRRLRKR